MQVERVYANISPKQKILEGILKKYKLTSDAVCFVGDDLVDLGIMKRVGLAIAVSNACQEIKEISHYITNRPGGRGAVREITELILKAQAKWQEAISSYLE
jgi:3-deoxy-D-manno-octulosonate 8-phosphate phosphatase (KDO 8-P phosphatase)